MKIIACVLAGLLATTAQADELQPSLHLGFSFGGHDDISAPKVGMRLDYYTPGDRPAMPVALLHAGFERDHRVLELAGLPVLAARRYRLGADATESGHKGDWLSQTSLVLVGLGVAGIVVMHQIGDDLADRVGEDLEGGSGGGDGSGGAGANCSGVEVGEDCLTP